MSTNSVSSACRCLNDLCKIVRPSFGPLGKEILIKSNTGNIILTKNMITALEYLEMKEPIGKIIKDSILKTSRLSGKFSKTQIIYLKSLMMNFERCLTKQNDILTKIKLIKALEHVQHNFNNINEFEIAKDNIKTFEFKDLKDYVPLLIEGFLSETFSVSLKQIFVSLIDSFLKFVYCETLRFSIKFFDNLCHVVEGFDISLSKVMQGIIITRQVAYLKARRDNVRFIVITGDMQRISSSGMELTFHEDNSLSNHFTNTEQVNKKFVNILKEHDITLVITQNKSINILAELLQHNNIYLIQFVSEDEIDYILSCFDICPLSSFYDIFNIENMHRVVGNAQYIQPLTLGKKYACHLGPPVVSHVQNPCLSIIITAPHSYLGHHIKQTFLRFISYLFETVKIYPVKLIAVGGGFESVLSKYFLFEEQNVCDIDNKLMYNLLSKSCIEVISSFRESIANSNSREYLKYMLSLQDYSSREIKCFDLIKRRFCDCDDVDSYEPFVLKCNAISSIIQVCVQILRIDQMVPVTSLSIENTTDEYLQTSAFDDEEVYEKVLST